MRALLERDPEKRLGSKKGAAEIRAHPFFADIKWPLIRNKVTSTPCMRTYSLEGVERVLFAHWWLMRHGGFLTMWCSGMPFSFSYSFQYC